MIGAPITGLVLAGGQGSRLGGRDKGLVDWQGRPLVARVLERLAPQVDHLLISANRNLDVYRAFGPPVVQDAESGFGGPLAGILAGLRACPTPLLAVVPCDAPDLPLDLVARLREAMAAAGTATAAACTDSGLQPTFLLCRRQLATDLAAWLAAGRHKLGAWLAETGTVPVHFPETGFRNLNRPEDFAHQS